MNISSSSIPGNEQNINAVINQLYTKGAKIVYESLAEVHVSGHAYQEELKTMHSILRPKFFVPCHGEYRHLKAHSELANDLGLEKRNILIPELGDTIVIGKHSIKKGTPVTAGIKLVDGVEISDAGGVVQRDRIQLASEGICVVVITISAKTATLTSKPDIISRGFVYLKDNEDMMEEARDLVVNTILNVNFKTQDWALVRMNIKKALTNLFYKKLKHKPMIIPVIIETN